MPEVNVEINGRKYRMACEEGQEPHLLALATRFNQSIESMRGSFGEIGDNRLTVMAGIAALDELGEAERQIGTLRAEVERLTAVGDQISEQVGAFEARVAKRLAEAARKIEAVATAIDETGAPIGS